MQDIDLVLPCYNPPADFVEMVDLYFKDLKAYYPDRRLNLFVVNDGSTCNFNDIQIQKLHSIQESVHIVSYSSNRGKGYALRKAINITSSPLIVYTDYDFPFRVECIKELIEELDKNADIVLVSRNKEYLRELPLPRKIYSLMSKQLNRIFLGMEYNETQGGLKGFNQKGKEIFLSTTINEFLFDTEFVYRASLRKGVSIVNIKGLIREDIKPNRINFYGVIRELVNFYRITKIKV
jgi:glycosyltransferase involved in cell wall biosynthesis